MIRVSIGVVEKPGAYAFFCVLSVWTSARGSGVFFADFWNLCKMFCKTQEGLSLWFLHVFYKVPLIAFTRLCYDTAIP